MIYLSNPSLALNVQISANSNVEYIACWADVSSGGLNPNVAMGVIANTNVATIVPATQSLTVGFQIVFLSLVNTDPANTQNIKISANNGISQANLIPSAQLLPGWALQYVDGLGFQILDASSGLVPDVYSATASNAANGAFLKANAAYQLANQGFVIGTQAFINANLAAIQANAAANTMATFANGTLVLGNANLNFNNTATVNVGITANGTTQVNAAFTVNTSQVSINTGPVVSSLWFTYSGV